MCPSTDIDMKSIDADTNLHVIDSRSLETAEVCYKQPILTTTSKPILSPRR
jgi:hypothetical protein